MTDPTETATRESTVVAVFEQHDVNGTSMTVALVRPRTWHFLTIEEARDLADKLFEAADVAEECSQEFGTP